MPSVQNGSVALPSSSIFRSAALHIRFEDMSQFRMALSMGVSSCWRCSRAALVTSSSHRSQENVSPPSTRSSTVQDILGASFSPLPFMFPRCFLPGCDAPCLYANVTLSCQVGRVREKHAQPVHRLQGQDQLQTSRILQQKVGTPGISHNHPQFCSRLLQQLLDAFGISCPVLGGVWRSQGRRLFASLLGRHRPVLWFPEWQRFFQAYGRHPHFGKAFQGPVCHACLAVDAGCHLAAGSTVTTDIPLSVTEAIEQVLPACLFSGTWHKPRARNGLQWRP